jgi:16S rRNA (uracil1498-N3)-methyltransferase
MQLFYSQSIGESILLLENEEHIHCTKTLRHRIGDEIYAIDGSGALYLCRILEIGKAKTECVILTVEQKPAPARRIGIAITPTKNPSRLEWFVEKAVEIGISDILIYQSARAEKKSTNMQRLEKIILSAMKQSGNIHKPGLSYFPQMSQFMDTLTATYAQVFVGYCEEKAVLFSEVHDKTKDVLVVIGPEGDFTPEEVRSFTGHGAKTISLGISRLRTETAGLVALTLAQHG